MSLLSYLRSGTSASAPAPQPGPSSESMEEDVVTPSEPEAVVAPAEAALDSRLPVLPEEESASTVARLAQCLQEEKEARKADIVALRNAVRTLAGAPAPQDGAAQREELAELKSQMELQAGALREGLMDIHKQRMDMQQQKDRQSEGLIKLAKKVDEVAAGSKAGAATSSSADAAGVAAELRKEIAQVRDDVGAQLQELQNEVRRGRTSSGNSPTREECAAAAKGLCEGTEGVAQLGLGDKRTGKSWQENAAVARRLQVLVQQIDQRYAEISEALAAEGRQRQAEFEDLQRRLQASEDLGKQLQASAESVEQRATESVLQQLRLELNEQHDRLADELATAGAQRADQLERKVLSMQARLEETIVPRSEIAQLSQQVLDIRSEAASRQLVEGAGADDSNVRSQLEGLTERVGELDARIVACVGELDARIVASDAKLSGELGRLVAAVDLVQGSAQVATPTATTTAATASSLATETAERGQEAPALTSSSRDVRAVAAELEELRASSASIERRLKLEIERVASLDVAGVRGELAQLREQVEASEAREKILQSEVSVSLRLGQDAAARLSALTAQVERMQAPHATVAPPGQMRSRQVLTGGPGPSLTTSPSSMSFLAKTAPVMISPSVHLPVTQTAPATISPSVQLPVAQVSTPRGNPHSVPAAMNGLVEAAYALQPGAARRKALVVACSYQSSQAPLVGTLNDAWNVHCLLRHTLQYSEGQVRLLIDGSELGESRLPTKAGIIEGLGWLVADAQPGDDLLFYFSGYGTQQPVGLQGNLYEAHLVPTDFAEGQHHLVPLAEISRAIATLPASCKVTLVLDTCFSLLPGLCPVGAGAQPATGVAFHRVSMKPPPPVQVGDASSAFAPRSRYLDLPSRVVQPGRPVSTGPGGVPEPACVVHCFSACQHPQRCVEVPVEGIVQGAFTWAWVKALIAVHLEAQATQLGSALRGVLGELKDHYPWMDQTPVLQLSSSAKLREGSGQREEASPGKALKQRAVPLPANHRRRKALLIGVNYADSNWAPAELKGCVNDAWNVHSVLRKVLHYTEDQLRVLVDGEHGAPSQAARTPTRANIIAGLQWLVSGAQPGDSLFLLFCGHGSQHPTSLGSNEYEAYLLPSDFAADVPEDVLVRMQQDRSASTSPSASHSPPPIAASQGVGSLKGYRLISMLEVNRLLARLPARSCLTMVLDCSYPMALGLSPAQSPCFSRVSRSRKDHRKLRDYISRPRFLELPIMPVQHTPEQLRPPAAPECLVHCFAACRLEEWSCELPLEGTVQGTFTWAFTKALAAGQYKLSVSKLQEALQQITTDLQHRFSGIHVGVAQTPVLSLSQASSGDNQVLSA